jgi:hypothetical protein
MAIITLNNNSLSSVTALPAAIATGKVLQVDALFFIQLIVLLILLDYL